MQAEIVHLECSAQVTYTDLFGWRLPVYTSTASQTGDWLYSDALISITNGQAFQPDTQMHVSGVTLQQPDDERQGPGQPLLIPTTPSGRQQQHLQLQVRPLGEQGPQQRPQDEHDNNSAELHNTQSEQQLQRQPQSPQLQKHSHSECKTGMATSTLSRAKTDEQHKLTAPDKSLAVVEPESELSHPHQGSHLRRAQDAKQGRPGKIQQGRPTLRPVLAPGRAYGACHTYHMASPLSSFNTSRESNGHQNNRYTA